MAMTAPSDFNLAQFLGALTDLLQGKIEIRQEFEVDDNDDVKCITWRAVKKR